MNTVFEILESCLRDIDRGESLESILTRFPEHRRQLKPILEASIEARLKAAKPEELQALRSQQLQLASVARHMRRHSRYGFAPRVAAALVLTLMLFTTGAGLLNASAAALPGDRLYTLKRAWENIQLIAASSDTGRKSLEDSVDSERLMEVSSLLRSGRSEAVEFVGAYFEINGKRYVSGIEVDISDTALAAAGDLKDGTPVRIAGQTDGNASVVVAVIDVLPAGDDSTATAFIPTIAASSTNEPLAQEIVMAVDSIKPPSAEDEFGSHATISTTSDHASDASTSAGTDKKHGASSDATDNGNSAASGKHGNDHHGNGNNGTDHHGNGQNGNGNRGHDGNGNNPKHKSKEKDN